MLTANIEDGPRGPSSKHSLGTHFRDDLSQPIPPTIEARSAREDRSSAESATCTQCGEQMNHGRQGMKKKDGTTKQTNLHE
jgi:hypothetical protein